MTQYDERVELQREKLAAEEWGKRVKDLHAFNSNNTCMWYDDRQCDGRVIDTRFNDGRIQRYIVEEDRYIEIGKKLRKRTIFDMWKRAMADRRRRNG